MKIASWNVNSIRTRLDQLTGWLVRAAPDVVCLQETKVEDELFPQAALGEVGYRAVIVRPEVVQRRRHRRDASASRSRT